MFHEPAAGRIDVDYFVGEVPEIAATGIAFRVPVVGQFDLSLVIAWRGQKHQRVASLRVLTTPDFAQTQRVAIKNCTKRSVAHYRTIV